MLYRSGHSLLSTPSAPQFDRATPVIPVNHARLMLRVAGEHALTRDVLLAGLGIDDATIDDDAALLSIDQMERLLLRTIELANFAPEMGYELGLGGALTTYPLLAYAMLSQVTLADAIRTGIQYCQAFIPVYRGQLATENGQAVLDVSLENAIDERLHRHVYDMALLSAWQILMPLMGGSWPEVEILFGCREPEHHAAYRERLPDCRFDSPANQIRFPASQLKRRIYTGHPVMAQLMTDRLTTASRRPQHGQEDIVALVRAKLVRGEDGYPGLESVGAELYMSSRTLKRKLERAGTGFQVLLDEVRERDAKRLLRFSRMSIAEISAWMGYTEPANFTHAFRRWAGMPPSEWRDRRRAKR